MSGRGLVSTSSAVHLDPLELAWPYRIIRARGLSGTVIWAQEGLVYRLVWTHRLSSLYCSISTQLLTGTCIIDCIEISLPTLVLYLDRVRRISWKIFHVFLAKYNYALVPTLQTENCPILVASRGLQQLELQSETIHILARDTTIDHTVPRTNCNRWLDYDEIGPGPGVPSISSTFVDIKHQSPSLHLLVSQ